MGTTGVPNGYRGCTKWAAGKRSGVAKRCWALWRCVFVCLRGHIRWHLRVCGEFGRSITITGQLARLSTLSRRQISGPSSFMRTTSAVGVLAIPRNSSACPPQFLRNSSAVPRNSSAIPQHFPSMPRIEGNNRFEGTLVRRAGAQVEPRWSLGLKETIVLKHFESF